MDLPGVHQLRARSRISAIGPEGMWLYSLDRHEETLEMHVPLDELGTRDEEIRGKVLRLRS